MHQLAGWPVLEQALPNEDETDMPSAVILLRFVLTIKRASYPPINEYAG